MHFSEDDLRAALSHQDPSPDFTQRVMASIGQASERRRKAADARFASLVPPAMLRWAAAGVAACLLLGTGWFDFRHTEGERAKEQAMLALRVTNAKLNHVFVRAGLQHTGPAEEENSKIRKEHL
ncbi:MAG TPA: hypothetical protein VKZ53_03645 [Candidatus Angelobacter sp.]|nr:hypothetical protein [Candidatus Angelobacter sp.]